MAVLVAVLFWPAGTLDWWRGWVVVGLFGVGTIGSILGLARRNIGLLEERMKPIVQPGQPVADRILVTLLVASFFGSLAFTPLDVFRLHLFARPSAAVSAFGLGMFATGWYVAYASLRENSFAAPVVRHQSERGQRVIDTGVYGIVRHPMYSGGVLVMLGIPLWLQSYAGAAFALIPVAILALRCVLEERFLLRELAGYKAYTRRVRRRLIPFVW